MMSHAPEDGKAPFSGLEPPAPPTALRGRVLANARKALALEGARDAWTRIWESRPLRLAWVAVTLLLVVAHVVLTVRPPERGGGASRSAAAPSPDVAGELAAVAGLSPLNEDLLPRLDASAVAPAVRPGPAPSAPAERIRKESSS
jgi:hypothetical protein